MGTVENQLREGFLNSFDLQDLIFFLGFFPKSNTLGGEKRMVCTVVSVNEDQSYERCGKSEIKYQNHNVLS